uniref:DUF2062 domain-containing protein n=1 Tax=Oryza meridionalis TaxID=40149 RepID=A0A0E0DKU9_9ORYZ
MEVEGKRWRRRPPAPAAFAHRKSIPSGLGLGLEFRLLSRRLRRSPSCEQRWRPASSFNSSTASSLAGSGFLFAKKMSFFTRIGVWPWIQNKVVDPLMQVVRRGAEPKQLAFSAALGVTLGIFPICGTTVILCGVAIAMLGSRCNAVTVMVLNFVVTPLELSLIVPFLRFGEVITGSGHFPLTSDAFKKVITGQASKDVMLSIVHAMLGWLIAAPFALAALYMVFIPCFKLMVDRFGGVPSSPRTPIKLV